MAQKVEVINPLDVAASAVKDKEKSAAKVQAKRKGADKWKKKIWYQILAPEEFERRPLGETVAEAPELIANRIVTITGRELANQPKKSHIHLKFKVTGISGNRASTEAIGHDIKDSYMRRVVRRRSSKIMSVKNYNTKDNKAFKIKTVIVTEKKASKRQKKSMLKKAEEITAKGIAELEAKKVVDELVFGTLANKIFPEVKRVVPVKRVEITSSQLIA